MDFTSRWNQPKQKIPRFNFTCEPNQNLPTLATNDVNLSLLHRISWRYITVSRTRDPFTESEEKTFYRIVLMGGSSVSTTPLVILVCSFHESYYEPCPVHRLCIIENTNIVLNFRSFYKGQSSLTGLRNDVRLKLLETGLIGTFIIEGPNKSRRREVSVS